MVSRYNRYNFNPGDTIDNYTVLKKMKVGGFCDIFLVKHTETGYYYAMKIESRNARKRTLPTEKTIYEKFGKYKNFPKLIEFKKVRTKNILVMELLGPNLFDLRRINELKMMDKQNALRIGIEMLRDIQVLHLNGYIHRDIKPHNFLIRPNRKYPVVLADFGLAKRYTDPETDKMLPARTNVAFAGTITYSSPYVLSGHDARPRDDVISWFFTLLELLCGQLPWSDETDRKIIGEMMTTIEYRDVSRHCPFEVFEIYKIVIKYGEDDMPDYTLLKSYLVKSMRKNKVKWDDPYMWDEIDYSKIKHISEIDLHPRFDKQPKPVKNVDHTVVYGKKSARKSKANHAKGRSHGCLLI